MKLVKFALVLIAGLLSSNLADAKTVRFPEAGDPAFVLDMPDDWSAKLDEDGNMIVGAADHSSGFSFSIIEYSDSLDSAATLILKAAGAQAPSSGGSHSISGYPGSDYASTMKNDSGVNLNVHMVIVRLDANHIATATLIADVDATSDEMRAAEAVLSNAFLTHKP